MAKVIITITDKKDGEVNVSTEFKPALKKNAEGTPAQYAAYAVLEFIHNHAADDSEDYEEDIEDVEDAEIVEEEEKN